MRVSSDEVKGGGASALIGIVKRRRSQREYLDKSVPREMILDCIEAVRFAPSACHVQPWRFLIIDEPELKEKLAKAAFSGIYSATRFAAKAPALVVILTRFDWFVQGAGRQIQGTQYHLLDAGIAGEHFVLRAVELGLGTCWIGWYNRRKVRRILKIPRRYRICAMISLGWPPEGVQFQEKRRMPAEHIASFNSVAFAGD